MNRISNPRFSDSVSKVAAAISAKLSEETGVIPIIDSAVRADLFIALSCERSILGVVGTANAL
jgi:hypothetical protein